MKIIKQIQQEYLENESRLLLDIGLLLEDQYNDRLKEEDEETLRLHKSMFTWKEEYFLDISMSVDAWVSGSVPVSLKDFIVHAEGGDTGFDYEIGPDDFDQTGDQLLYDGHSIEVDTGSIRLTDLKMN